MKSLKKLLGITAIALVAPVAFVFGGCSNVDASTGDRGAITEEEDEYVEDEVGAKAVTSPIQTGSAYVSGDVNGNITVGFYVKENFELNEDNNITISIFTVKSENKKDVKTLVVKKDKDWAGYLEDLKIEKSNKKLYAPSGATNYGLVLTPDMALATKAKNQYDFTTLDYPDAVSAEIVFAVGEKTFTYNVKKAIDFGTQGNPITYGNVTVNKISKFGVEYSIWNIENESYTEGDENFFEVGLWFDASLLDGKMVALEVALYDSKKQLVKNTLVDQDAFDAFANNDGRYEVTCPFRADGSWEMKGSIAEDTVVKTIVVKIFVEKGDKITEYELTK